MKNYLDKLQREIKKLIYLAGDIAFRNNMSAYLVGGFVRDLLFGVKNLDLDIIVEGDGIKFAEDFAGEIDSKLIRHKRFGTATVIINHHLKVDIATTRKESYPEPASLPIVTYGNLKDDLSRRDFTINAMAISITGRDFGSLIDSFEGKADLDKKKIRVLHDLSFIDDPTRMLRAIRFERRYDFRIEPKTLKNLKEAVRLKILRLVQPQRLRDELILILKEGAFLNMLRRMQELVGFDFIHSHLHISQKTYQLLNSLKTQISWFKTKYSQRRKLDIWLIYFMALIDSLSIEEIKSVLKKFSLRKGEEKRILTYKKISSKFIRELKQNKISPSRVFSLLEPLSYEVIIFIKAKYKNKNFQRHIEDFFEIYNNTRLRINGEDLHRLGISPSPYYQKIFQKVLNAKLNGLLKTKDQELEFAKKIIKKSKLKN